MAYYYSAAERAFFSSELMSTDAMPSDKVAVADQAYKQLMADQVAGKLIRTGSGNAPESVDQGLTAATRFGDVSFGKVTGTSLDINGNGDVSGTFVVGGAVTIKGALNAQGGLNVTSITATGTSTLAAVNATNLSLSGTLKVNGASTLQAVSAKKITATEIDLNGSMDASGNVVVHGKTTLEALQANGDTTIGGLLKVTGATSLNGGGTVKTPTYAVSDTSLVNASWVWNLIQRYGLSGKASQADILWPSRDLNDIDVTGFYTVASDWKNSPRGEESQTFTGILIHVQRYFNAGPISWQMCVHQTTPNVIFYRVKNGSVWSEWLKIAQDDDVVHLAGSETIVGEKSIKNHINLIRAVNKGDKSTISHRQIKWLDPNGESMGLISLRTGTDGSTRLEFYAYKNESGNTSEAAHFFIEVTETGVARCYLPATADNATSEEGVTARWARSKFLALDGSTSMAANLKLGPHAPVIESTQTVDSNDSIPDVSRFNGHSVYAENGDRIAYIQLASRNDGRREYNMYVRNPYVAGEVFHGLKWGFAADASFYAQLTQGPVTSSDDNSIATTAWVRALLEAGLGEAIPAGTILPYAGKTVPSGFLAANGGNVSRTTYARLYGAIGTTWGSGDGSTTFKLPDFRNRTIWGANAASEVGTYLESGAPNITGWHGGHAYKSYDHNETGGAFYGMDEKHGGAGATTNCDVWKMGFDASLSSPIYGASDIIQPPAGKALWIIKT